MHASPRSLLASSAARILTQAPRPRPAHLCLGPAPSGGCPTSHPRLQRPSAGSRAGSTSIGRNARRTGRAAGGTTDKELGTEVSTALRLPAPGGDVTALAGDWPGEAAAANGRLARSAALQTFPPRRSAPGSRAATLSASPLFLPRDCGSGGAARGGWRAQGPDQRSEAPLGWDWARKGLGAQVRVKELCRHPEWKKRCCFCNRGRGTVCLSPHLRVSSLGAASRLSHPPKGRHQ